MSPTVHLMWRIGCLMDDGSYQGPDLLYIMYLHSARLSISTATSACKPRCSTVRSAGSTPWPTEHQTTRSTNHSTSTNNEQSRNRVILHRIRAGQRIDFGSVHGKAAALSPRQGQPRMRRASCPRGKPWIAVGFHASNGPVDPS